MTAARGPGPLRSTRNHSSFASATGSRAACYIVKDHNRQSLAYVYFEDKPGRRSTANLLSRDEARRAFSVILHSPYPTLSTTAMT
jgi:hypothetical protein